MYERGLSNIEGVEFKRNIVYNLLLTEFGVNIGIICYLLFLTEFVKNRILRLNLPYTVTDVWVDGLITDRTQIEQTDKDAWNLYIQTFSSNCGTSVNGNIQT